MAPERSKSEKGQGFFSRLFRRSSSTKGRPTISNPDPFLSQNHIRPQDLYTLQDAREKKKQPANVPSFGANPSSSQGARPHHRSNLSFSERMKTDFRAGVDETNAAFRSGPSTAGRRRERENPYAAPPPAHLANARPPLRRQREPIRPFPISAPIAPANLADSAHDAAARDRERQQQQEREWAFTKVTQPIQTVPARHIQLNPPAAHQSVHVEVASSSSSDSRSTRWEDFAGPPPTAPPSGPLPAVPPLRRSHNRHGPAPPRPVAALAPPPAPTRNPAPTPLCGICRTHPSLPASTLCSTCSFQAYRRSHRRSPSSPVSPLTPPLPPIAHLKDSAYTQSRRARDPSSATYTPQPVSPLSPPGRSRPLQEVHPALRRSSRRVPFESEGDVWADAWMTGGGDAQVGGGVGARSPRRGAVSSGTVAVDGGGKRWFY